MCQKERTTVILYLNNRSLDIRNCHLCSRNSHNITSSLINVYLERKE